jgi:ribonuclease BN (tRNA processing enzyme)
MKLKEGFDVEVVEPGRELAIGPFRIITAPMLHSVPTIGVRVEVPGQAMAYSADTGPTDELIRLASGCDLLVAEASWQEDGLPKPPIHLTSREAGETAARAGCRGLILTHLRPYLDRDRSREEAAGAFDGEVLVAEEGLEVEVSG